MALPSFQMPPAAFGPAPAKLSATVTLWRRVAAPGRMYMPATPSAAAELLLIVVLMADRYASTQMPPKTPAVFPDTVTRSSLTVASPTPRPPISPAFSVISES